MKLITIIEQYNDNQYTFYNVSNNNVIRKFSGFEFASIRNSIDDVAGDYGSVYVTSKYGTRRISIEGDLIGSDIFTQRRLLNRALGQTGIIKLFKITTYDDILLQFEAEIAKVVNPYNHQIHSFLIEAIAPDWRFYSQTERSVDISQTGILGGATIPASIPMSIASPSATDSEITNIVTNSGNEKTDPVFTLSGPGTDFTVENVTTDKSFTLEATLVEGDTVEIDVKNRTVVKNGSVNLYSSFSGDFFSIVPGENEFRFMIDSGLEIGTTNLNVAFRDAYNGI